MPLQEITVPDLGDFEDVPIIEVLVEPGDVVAPEDPLITLESEKATMDVPAPVAGTIETIMVAVGDTVSQGSPILTLSGDAAAENDAPAPQATEPTPTGEPTVIAEEPSDDGRADVLVIGSGPGGYTAAFRAADLGLRTVLVERYPTLGGVCLNVGCIPSKALLHAARVIAETEEAADFGLSFGAPAIDLDRLRVWKDEVVGTMTKGLDGLARRREVEVVHGEATFSSPHTVSVDGTEIPFRNCIIAAGSRPISLPNLPDDPRIVDSTGALELPDVPERLLVVGGGIIGLEMACVYDALGSQVTVVELTETLMPGCDRDLVKPLQRRIEGRYEAIKLETAVAGIEAGDAGLVVAFEGASAGEPQAFDRVLLAVGRRANGDLLNAEAAGIEVSESGLIGVDEQMRTNVPHVFAIGDIVGEPMLAHKATHEGTTAAEAIAGHDVAFDARSIPSVAYTDPEVAWTGLTETHSGDVPYEKAVFPWAASGRAHATDRAEGHTKLLVDPESRRILGGGIVGPNAGELIAEIALAIEMGANATDLALTVHPHPTLSESVGMAAEVAEGVATDLYAPKRHREPA
jgi:dihydrolipoamide dehydrogenase